MLLSSVSCITYIFAVTRISESVTYSNNCDIDLSNFTLNFSIELQNDLTNVTENKTENGMTNSEPSNMCKLQEWAESESKNIPI